jgi:dTMP kinase
MKREKKQAMHPQTAPLHKGQLITFEGGEGVGKSSLIEGLYTYLQKKGVPVISVREPGGTVLGEKIRLLLLDPLMPMTKWAELFLFLSARAEHYQNVIRPAIEEGKIVLCDRFHHSTIVYQGIVRSLGEERVRELSLLATEGKAADKTIFLSLDPAIGLSRRQKVQALDRIEQETLAFHKQVQQAYLHLAKKESLFIIDASLSPEEVLERAIILLEL